MKKISWHELKPQVKEVWVLSLPAILTQITTIVMQYIDSAMVGSLGANASAAIGLVSTSTWLLGGITYAVSAGFSVQVAHNIGAGRDAEARSVVRHGLCTALCVAGILCALGLSIHSMLPTWLGGDPAIRYDASKYFMVYALMIPFSQINSLNSSFLQCSGDMLTPSILNAAMCLLDVVFNTIFIPHFGVMGAGIGTASACAVVSLTMAWRCLLCNPHLRLNRKETEKHGFDPEILKKALKIGLPVGVQEIAMCSAQVVATMIIAPLGAVSIAGKLLRRDGREFVLHAGLRYRLGGDDARRAQHRRGKDRPCQALRQYLYRDGRGLYGDNGTFDDVPVPVCIQYFDTRSLRPRACGTGVAHRAAG